MRSSRCIQVGHGCSVPTTFFCHTIATQFLLYAPSHTRYLVLSQLPRLLAGAHSPALHVTMHVPNDTVFAAPTSAATAAQSLSLTFSTPSKRSHLCTRSPPANITPARTSGRTSQLQMVPNCSIFTPAGTRVEPGFMHIDTDGRVIRVDTLSKCVAPGMRAGWICAPAATLAILRAALVTSTMGPSGHAVMAFHALTQAWGHSGFEAHLRAVQVRASSIVWWFVLREPVCCSAARHKHFRSVGTAMPADASALAAAITHARRVPPTQP